MKRAPQKYTLCIGEKSERQEGPCTARECRERLDAIFPGLGWHWEASPDGSQVARDDANGRLLAVAVPN